MKADQVHISEEPLTILVVDDHEMLREAICDWLRLEMSPCQVIEIENAENAMDMIRNSSPDIIVMDISLPGLNGIDATRNVKSQFSNIPIVMLSFFEETVYQQAAFQAGASAYVFKREMFDNLIPVLKQLLNGKATSSQLYGVNS